MARTLTANFQAQATASSCSPYLILGIDWPDTGTYTYYLDRNPQALPDAGDFATEDDLRHPAVATFRVQQWPPFTIQLRENQISASDQITLSLWDGDKALKALFDADPKQRRRVKIWRMFDDASVTWGTDELLIFYGATMPFSFRESDQLAQITCQDISGILDKAIGKNADQTVFSEVDLVDQDKPLPVILGRPRRVEAILVKSKKYTQTLEQVASTGLPTFDIVDHPDDLGIPTGAGNPQIMRLGDDRITGYFTQSGDPENTPSTFTITVQDFVTSGYCKILKTQTTTKLTVRKSDLRPRGVDLDAYDVGDDIRIRQWGGTETETTIDKLQIGGDFGPDTITIELTDALPSTDGGYIEFTDSFVTQERKPWPTGTPLIEAGLGARYEYLVNMLPSEAVKVVESFGSIEDDSGDVNKSLIALDGSSYVTDLDNSEWAGSLGHNVTTVEFYDQPRRMFPFLDEDRIWVELEGIKVGGTYNDNPFDLMEELLTNAHLGNIDAADVNSTSFATVKADTQFADYQFAYPMMTIAPVIGICQELSQQAHCVLQFDQGQVRLVLLRNTSPATVANFTSANIADRTLRISETSIDDLVSHVVGNWRRDWDDKMPPQVIRVWGKNSTIETTFRKNLRQMPFIAYAKRDYVVDEITFWLTRWSKVYRIVEFTTFLDGLIVQPGDWVNVDFTDGESNVVINAEDCEVLRVQDNPQTHMIRIVCRYAIHDYS